jgi:hypothetical protein
MEGASTVPIFSPGLAVRFRFSRPAGGGAGVMEGASTVPIFSPGLENRFRFSRPAGGDGRLVAGRFNRADFLPKSGRPVSISRAGPPTRKTL